jgi:predicted enzyme related to lactoylglutathione lyase
MFKSIAQIYLSVHDVTEARDFYCSLLSLPFDQSYEIAGVFSMIQIGDIEFCFHKGDEKNPVSSGGAIPYWRVDDFDGFIVHATKMGCKMYRGPIQIERSNRHMGQMIDPFGFVFGIEGLKDRLLIAAQTKDSELECGIFTWMLSRYSWVIIF